jgi:RHS repeat-associated protein
MRRGAPIASMMGLASLFLAVALAVPAARAAQGEEPRTAAPEPAQELLSVLPSGEIPALRSRTTRTFVRERSTYELQAFTRSINYQDEQGDWQPIDSSLVPALAPGYALRNKANRYLLQLPASLALAPVRISEGGRWLSFSLEGAQGVLEPGERRATYREALPHVSVEYEPSADSVKENLVLASAEAQSSFRFLVDASAGLEASAERGGVLFRTQAGDTAFSFAPPFMIDAAGARSDNVSFSLKRLPSGWALSLTADQAWLQAPERRYPVAIDPTTFLGPWDGQTPYSEQATDCSLKSDAQANTSFCAETQLEVGTEAGSTRRTLVRFETLMPRLPAMSTVLVALLSLNVAQAPASPVALDVHRVTRAWTANAPSWNSYDGVNPWTTPGGDFHLTPLSSQTVGPSSTGYVRWRVTETVQQWVNGDQPAHGFIVKAQNEASAPVARFKTDTNNFGSVGEGDPHVSIRYRHRTGALRQYSFDAQELSDRQSLGVNLANANVLVENTDLAAPGTGLDLEVERFYNARDYATSTSKQAIGSVGRGWTLSLGPDVGLEIYSFDGGSAVFYGPSGFAVYFPKRADGTFETPLHGLEAKLAQVGDEYVLTMNRSGHKYTFNSAGFLIKEEDRNANDIRYDYDAENRLTQIIDTQDRVVTATYNAQGLIESLSDWTGRVVRYGYDTSKRLTSFTDAAGKVTSYTYDSSHRLTKITDPLLQETRITYALGSDDAYEVTVTRVTDPATGAGSKTRYQTCPRGQRFCPIDNEAYWEQGQRRTLVTDPNNNKTLFYTDGHGRVHKVKDALMRIQSTVQLNDNHDPDWRKGFHGDSQQTSFNYSNEGRFNLTSTKIPTDESLTEEWRYGEAHPYLPNGHTDPQGKITSFGYDARGNLETVTNALQRTARTYHNENNGTVKGVLDFKGIVNGDCPPTPAVSVCYGYDPQGNLTSVNNPAPLGDLTYTYDALSRVDTVRDGRGQVTNYDYDPLDRVDLITYHDGSTIDYVYDANGNLKTLIDNTGTTNFDYDKLNRLTQETLPGGRTNVYTYDPGGNLTSFTDAGGTVGYVYDGANNVTQITEPNAPPIVLAYHDDHLRKRITYPNGITQCFWYDFSDRIRSVWAQRDSTCPADPPPGRITGYDYSYDEGGADTALIQRVTDKAGNVTTYDYDPLNRLERASTTGPDAKSFAYTYDHNSNRLTQTVDGSQTTTYTYNNADQVETAGGTSFSYDGNGNELTASGRRTSTYNAKDQLDSLTPQGQAAMPMTYTGTGQFKRVTRGSTSFTNSALGVTREDATSYTVDPDGFVLGQRSPSRLYFLHDGLGSVVATANEAGSESLIARYDPFGGCLANCPTVPYRWLGALGVYFDSQTQLYKMGTRYYDPALGRFTQVDPVEGGSANRYDYAKQDPVNVADPDGTFHGDIVDFVQRNA